MPVLADLKSAVAQLTPLSLAEQSWDNVGVMVEPPFPREVSGNKESVLLCIDLTPAVAREALAQPNTTAILTYHPPIFSGLKSLDLSTPLKSSLLTLLAKGVAVFCVHTAADNAWDGTNDFIAGAFSPKDGEVKAIVEKQDVPAGQEGSGSGRLVSLASGLSKDAAVKATKSRLNLSHLQAAWAEEGSELISTVGICAGSGSSVLKHVSKANLWLTGELGHHEILAANASGTHVILTNHSASERPWLASFAPRLQKVMNSANGSKERYEVVVSTADKEPLQVV